MIYMITLFMDVIENYVELLENAAMHAHYANC